MVGELKRFNRDPNWNGRARTFRVGDQTFRLTKSRGAGLYYHRGNGYYSKRDVKLDRMIKAETRNKRRKGLHTHDLDKKGKRGWV